MRFKLFQIVLLILSSFAGGITAQAFAENISVTPAGGGGGGSPTGAAGGGLAGTYPNPTVASVPASAMPALTGDCTTSAGAVATTCLKTNGTAFTSLATAAVGQIPGIASASLAPAGDVGEFPSATVLSGAAIGVTSATPVNCTSGISLTTGAWDVMATAYFTPAATTIPTAMIASISATTGTLDLTPGKFGENGTVFTSQGGTTSVAAGPFRVNQSGTTTQFLVLQANFSVSTMTAYCFIRATRVF